MPRRKKAPIISKTALGDDFAVVSSPRLLLYQEDGANILAEYLRMRGFIVDNIKANSLLEKVAGGYDLIILDHYKGLDAPEGLAPLNVLTNSGKRTPTLMLSAKYPYEARIAAFDAGADDYVTKPYNMEELIRRINSLLGRFEYLARRIKRFYTIGRYFFDTNEGVLFIDQTKTKLDWRENAFLALLCANRGGLVDKRTLLERLWPDEPPKKTSLDFLLVRLRDALSRDNNVVISTVTGVGYSLYVKGGSDDISDLL